MDEKRERLINTAYAPDWAEGYPVGNGRLGAMVINQGKNERLALNHDLLWRDYVHFRKSHTSRDIDELKRLCKEGLYTEAERLMLRTQPMTGHAAYINPFVPAADLYITTDGGKESGYSRRLELDEGRAIAEYNDDDLAFHKETIASAADGVVLTSITSNRGAFISGRASLSRIADPECTLTASATPSSLSFDGLFDEGGSFSVLVKLYNRGGRLALSRREYNISGEARSPENGVESRFIQCDGLLAAVFISTGTESAVHGLTPAELNARRLAEFERKYPDTADSYPLMYAAHLARWKEEYGGERIRIGEESGASNEELLAGLEENGEVSGELAQRLFSLSRYLCVSSGMDVEKGEYPKAPINLQGLWNQELCPPWESDYHLDLNLEMCYWAMDGFGIGGLCLPLMSWVERVSPQGRIQARDLYGCGGIAFNGCCDYRTIGMTDNVGYFWLGAAAWLADILWRHWEYTRDEAFLRRLMPFMSEISDFFADILEPDENGGLYPPFGASPEFTVRNPDGASTFVHNASAIDMELIHALFSHLSEAYSVLGGDERSERNENILSKLPLPAIREDGTLSEYRDTLYTEAEPGHRHRSPLVGLCPGDRISRRASPEYADAAYRLIKHREENGRACSQAFAYSWDTQLLARLLEGREAYEQLCGYARVHLLPNLLSTGNDWAQKHGGLSWFTGFKLFQIEACISAGAGTLEMIFSDRQSVMLFLPALPERFADGEAENLSARGGFTVSFEWRDSAVTILRIRSEAGGKCRLSIPAGMSAEDFGECETHENGEISVAIEKGGERIFTARKK